MTNTANNSRNATDDDDDNVVPLRRPTPRRNEWTPYREFLMRLRSRPCGEDEARPMLIAIDPNDGRIEARTLSEGREINAFVAKWNAERNIYYSANPTHGKLDKKAEKEDVYAIEYLLSDLDPVDDESPEEAKARYLKQLESFTPRPTMLMDSGNGLQALWQLKTPILLEAPIQLDEPIKVKGKSKPITRQFSAEDQAKVDDAEARSAALMRRLGAPTGTQNIDRILRLPGTLNLPSKTKRAKGRVPCETRLLWFEWSKYSLQDFELPPQEEEGTGRPEGKRRDNGNKRDGTPSGIFFKRVTTLTERGWSIEEIEADVHAHPEEWEDSSAARYEREGRLLDQIKDCAAKARKPTGEDWPEPKPLPHGLAPVAAFDTKFLPDALAPLVDDIAERLQCPPDYVGVSAVTALGSVIGRRVGIKPQAKTDWIEYANLWTVFIGQPGMLKSPAMLAALAPLHYLEAEAAKENQIAREAYEANLSAFKLRAQVKASLTKAALKSKGKEAAFDLGEKPEEPVAIRFRTNDSTYESLGEILIGNPNGILIERDELVSLLQHLDREEQAVARGFYMSGWAGTQPYTFDRVIRGHLHIEAVCLSILGNTQPVRINRYVRQANLGGGGDGLIQRFQLLVWPDGSGQWRDVDQYPDSDARRRAWNVFERMSTLDEGAVRKLGAHKGRFDKTFHFRFTEDAREEFVDWRRPFERRLRSGELSPALEGHFAKYRKLVPALALINHLADGGRGAVGLPALRKALAFSVYLESHAQRVYGAADMVELAAAEAILLHIKAGELADGFTARDVHRHGWSNLTERVSVQAGLDLLVDCDYLAPITSQPDSQGGRPKITFAINPKGMK
jgi:putative DNA primase/helicase